MKLLKYLLSFGVRMSAIECRLSSDLICDASIEVALAAVTFIAKFWAISAAENACGQWWSLLCGSWILKVLSSWKYKQDLNNRLGWYLRCLLFRCICNTQQNTSMSNSQCYYSLSHVSNYTTGPWTNTPWFSRVVVASSGPQGESYIDRVSKNQIQ